MTDESEISDSGPSDSGPSDDGTDIIKSVKRYTARSVFEISITRIVTILQMIESGIQNDTNRASELQIEFSNIQPISIRLENGSIKILTEGEVDTLKKALAYNLKFNEELPLRLIPLSQVDQYLGLAGRSRNGVGLDFFARC
jgi:hypothetical protein